MDLREAAGPGKSILILKGGGVSVAGQGWTVCLPFSLPFDQHGGLCMYPGHRSDRWCISSMTHDVNSHLSLPLPHLPSSMAEPHHRHSDDAHAPVPPSLQAKMAAVRLSFHPSFSPLQSPLFALAHSTFFFPLDCPTRERAKQQEE